MPQTSQDDRQRLPSTSGGIILPPRLVSPHCDQGQHCWHYIRSTADYRIFSCCSCHTRKRSLGNKLPINPFLAYINQEYVHISPSGVHQLALPAGQWWIGRTPRYLKERGTTGSEEGKIVPAGSA